MKSATLAMPGEQWLQFRASQYEVSSLGRVFGRRSGKVRKVQVDSKGYYSVSLSGILDHNQRFSISLHRMVAETFIPNPYNLPTINHIDGCKANNTLSNLEWASYSRQMQHAYRLDLIDPRKPTEGVVRLLRLFIGSGRSDADLANAYNLSEATIRSIRLAMKYTHIQKLNYPAK